MTKIEWCDDVWNPVWGCLNKCPYCYARKFAHRFGPRLGLRSDFQPQWVEKNYHKKLHGKYVFVNSMSDIAYWEPKWNTDTMLAICTHPDKTFLFLTKNPSIYYAGNWPDNVMLGATATTANDVCTFQDTLRMLPNKTFLSIEPIQQDVAKYLDAGTVDWVIVGAETGNRKGKIKPDPKWISAIEAWCVLHDVPLFEKSNLNLFEPIQQRP